MYATSYAIYLANGAFWSAGIMTQKFISWDSIQKNSYGNKLVLLVNAFRKYKHERLDYVQRRIILLFIQINLFLAVSNKSWWFTCVCNLAKQVIQHRISSVSTAEITSCPFSSRGMHSKRSRKEQGEEKEEKQGMKNEVAQKVEG